MSASSETLVYSSSSPSSSLPSSIGTTAHCGLWPVKKCPSIFSYMPPTLSIFSLPALEDLFLLPLSIFSWVFPFFSSLKHQHVSNQTTLHHSQPINSLLTISDRCLILLDLHNLIHSMARHINCPIYPSLSQSS